MELYSWNFMKEKIDLNIINDIMETIIKEYKNKVCYPAFDNIFNCFKYTNYDDLKVVIIGQDPYHGENEAHGLSFSVLEHCKTPPSLRNIFLELHNDLGIDRKNNNLEDWAKQGVLLLNAIMTVEKDKPLSHKNIGWENFTDKIIELISLSDKPLVFILWGNYAKSKKRLITNKKHLIIESAHPSFFSANRGFFGSKPFSKANDFLKQNNIKEIEWSDKNGKSI
ncbi:MAG TPA: uracil-DNA glycosylase [Tenericutes bacterium]|nr:uracil-DNA glycosylase [Mycoplasmatota bacterium]